MTAKMNAIVCQITILVLLLLILISAKEVRAESKARPNEETRIRAVGYPRAQFLVKSTALLQHAEVWVRNVGTSAAKGVKVYLLLPGGEHRPMRGATKIPPDREALYLIDPKVIFEKPITLKVETSCENCKR